MYYTISEIAKKIDLSPHTLRFYAKEGLTPFVERSQSGIRMFKEEDLEALFLIEYLKKSGMKLKEIKEFMEWCTEGDETIDQRLNMFKEQEQKVMEKINELHTALDLIKYKCWYYETAQAAGTCSVHNSITHDDIPENIRHIKDIMEAPLSMNKF
ncbi:putative HTH-type transcriptional regulator [bioreactor metagenome]|uniref:Putative HTH-type transcriptional regulator n=1 Tax=bioreactor metagenome TaxID=1076179 RepID=A0A645D9J6_9ZZZZ